MIYATCRRSGISSYPFPAWHRPRRMRGHGGGMDIWMESRFVSGTIWHPDLCGALHLVDLQVSSPSMLGATASLIRLKRNGVSGRGHLMPPLLVSQAGCGGRCPAHRFAGGSPVEAPDARCHPLSLLLALVACSGSPAAGPTATGATGATGPASAEPQRLSGPASLRPRRTGRRRWPRPEGRPYRR